MSEAENTTKRKMTPFPRTFYVANVMEIFERMAWYGFFALSSLYMTSPLEQGGLGFSSIQRGILQGIVPFLLYLFPVITGALADRYGYRRTFLVAFSILTPAYFLLGQFHSFWGFFGAFLLVAVGAATFKPVVVGTVGRVTNDSNRGMGFGVFYMIVNVGGFVGPIFAGMLRVLDWNYVFVLLAITIAINFIPTLFFYKEPTDESQSKTKRSLKKVLLDAQEVLGNGRFALTAVPIIVLLMLAGGEWLSWSLTFTFSVVWVIANLSASKLTRSIYLTLFTVILIATNVITASLGIGLLIGWALLIISDGWNWSVRIAVPAAVVILLGYVGVIGHASALAGAILWSIIALVWSKYFHEDKSSGLVEMKAKIGNWPFVLYLLILSGFWASFNQIFITLPEYIRDFVNTADLVKFAGIFGHGFVSFLASVNIEQLTGEITRLVNEHGAINAAQYHDVLLQIVHFKVRPPEQEMIAAFGQLAQNADPAMIQAVAQDWAEKYRQVNPEYIVNIDAGAIVLFQVLVSWVIQRWKPFPVLVVGTLVAGTGIALNSLAVSGALTIFAVVVFAFGEMIASPKSQEYVARIAPRKKTALFMGYYFVSIALGNLFGGILSGWGYQVLAKDQNKPGLMWIIYGLVGLATALALLIFNKLVVPTLERNHAASKAAEEA
ncbi:MAG: MFS transporter [bacterium]